MIAYAKSINQLLKDTLMTEEPFVLFGQNVAAGSCLSGLTRGLVTSGGLEMFNTPNCENAMVGYGFGLMMRGVNSAFFVKQHDFLLLTLDHMVNTYNMIKLTEPAAAFTIVCIVVDSGYEGPQSRLNNLSDFSSLADIDTFAINSRQDAEMIIPMMKEPGFRIVALSQRHFRSSMLDVSEARMLGSQVIQYHPEVEPNVLIVSMNFTLPQALKLREGLRDEYGCSATIVSLTSILMKDFSVLDDLIDTCKKVVVLDDSRSVNRSSDRLRLHLLENHSDVQVYTQVRSNTIQDIPPNADVFEVSTQSVYAHFSD